MAYNKTLGYDPDKDYSVALQDTSLTSAQRNQLLAERQAKIDNKYGGVEPNMTGKDKTFTQLYGTGAASAPSAATGQYAGTNYHQDAIDAAIAGNWDLVNAALAARENKVAATGQNYGKTSTEILTELMAQYYQQPEIELPTYDGGKWSSVLDQAANQLINMNYEDWLQGDQYKALADRYGLQGKMSMQDMLGQISSRTGGLASSYATTAAQQQYNDYMATLEQAAMEMYGGERSDLLENAQFAQGMEQQQYDRYLDSLGQYWQQMEFGNQQQMQDQALLAEKAETLAAYGDFSGYKALGYSDAQIALMQAAYQSQQAAAAAKGKGGGYNNGSVDKENIMLMQDALGVTPDGLWGSESQKAAKAAGWSTDADEAWAAFGGGVTPDKTGGNYDYWLGDGATAGGKTSLDWDQDEGVFTWNGQNYYTLDELANAIDAANLTAAEKKTLTAKLEQFDFDIEIT